MRPPPRCPASRSASSSATAACSPPPPRSSCPAVAPERSPPSGPAPSGPAAGGSTAEGHRDHRRLVVYCPTPPPDHQTAGRRLANLLERHARAAMSKGHECLTVNNDVDPRLRDLPSLNRRPDVALHRCLDRERGERLRAEHALLVVEIVSPGSETQDTRHAR
ncbi:Uma2 family endonuclease [Microbispora sp. NPDC046973]|uniref:Uma2 family endonuclease n=1 Tax=Microbispora sp. NPDC046973 TaxID=3155022 RepID=UPI0033C623B1